jgi:hypothetical protein
MTRAEFLLMILTALKFFEISIKLARLFVLNGMNIEEYADDEDEGDEDEDDEYK